MDTTDYYSTINKEINRLYPGYRLEGVAQYFVFTVGWCDTFIDDPEESVLFILRCRDAAARVNLHISNGREHRYPDYRLTELLSTIT